MTYKFEKFAKIGVVLIAYFFLRSLFWHKGVLEDNLILGHTEDEVLTNFLMSGYFGTEEVVLIGTLILLLAIEYLTEKEEMIWMLRFPNRERYLQERCSHVLYGALLASILRVLCGLAHFLTDFGAAEILNLQMGRFAFWYIFIYFLYGARCGIIYMIMRDLLNRRTMAMGIVMLIYFVVYYIYLSQWLYPIIHREISWVPFCDLDAPGAVYAELVPRTENYLVATRQLVLTLSTGVIWGFLWKKKDVIRLEK